MFNKIMINEYLEILNNIKPKRLLYSFVLISDCIVETSFYILTPIVMKLMIDASVSTDMNSLKHGILIAAVVCIFGMILFGTFEFFFFSIMHKTTAKVRNELFGHILHLPISYIEENHSGDTLSRLTNDVNTMEASYGWPLRNVIVSLFVGISSAAVMMILDWRASILLIGVGLISVFINSRQKDTIRKISNHIQERTSKYTENLSNILNGFFTIKNYQLEKMILNKANDINDEILKSTIQLTKKEAVMSSRNFFFESINFVGIIALAAFLAIKGNNLGSIVSLVFLVGNVNRMFSDTNSMILQLQKYLSGSNRVMELIKIPVENHEFSDNSNYKENIMIKLEEAAFSYDSQNNVLDNVNLTVKKGQVAALVGPSGGGKSTIMKLLLGYYPLSSGNIIINEKSINNYTMRTLREQIAYVPQDSYIFDGTIEENIIFGRQDASRKDVVEAAKYAYADEFIKELEDGYDTKVGERGIKLSGGQRQRIAIARAFLKNAPILLLDEATSSLDSESEQYVQEALNRLMDNRTVLIIAHRLSTIKNADVIYVIKEGKNMEQGNHEELLFKDSLYKELYELQFANN